MLFTHLDNLTVTYNLIEVTWTLQKSTFNSCKKSTDHHLTLEKYESFQIELKASIYYDSVPMKLGRHSKLGNQIYDIWEIGRHLELGNQIYDIRVIKNEFLALSPYSTTELFHDTIVNESWVSSDLTTLHYFAMPGLTFNLPHDFTTFNKDAPLTITGFTSNLPIDFTTFNTDAPLTIDSLKHPMCGKCWRTTPIDSLKHPMCEKCWKITSKATTLL